MNLKNVAEGDVSTPTPPYHGNYPTHMAVSCQRVSEARHVVSSLTNYSYQVLKDVS